MKITSKPLRILAMVGIGIVLALVFYAIGLPQKSIGPLTGGILFFVWMWLGGKWWWTRGVKQHNVIYRNEKP